MTRGPASIPTPIEGFSTTHSFQRQRCHDEGERGVVLLHIIIYIVQTPQSYLHPSTRAMKLATKTRVARKGNTRREQGADSVGERYQSGILAQIGLSQPEKGDSKTTIRRAPLITRITSVSNNTTTVAMTATTATRFGISERVKTTPVNLGHNAGVLSATTCREDSWYIIPTRAPAQGAKRDLERCSNLHDEVQPT